MNIELSPHTLDVIKTTTSCLTFVALIFTIRQIKLAKSTILLNSIKGIHEENIKVRKYFERAVLQREELVSILTNDKSDSERIYYIYGTDKYNDLREIGYHYEYTGILVKNKILPFKVLFSLIPFPDKFWKESSEFCSLMRENYVNEFWENFEYLQKRYERERKK